jgi:hypothetical protein
MTPEGFFPTLLDYCGRGKVALLQAYFDESERRNGLLCVAGYVFSAPQAKHFSKEFGAVFGCYGGFHMVDLVARKGGFKRISEADRDRLIKKAVDITKKRFSYGVAVTVNIAEYEAQAPRFIRGFRSAYSFLCHLAMTSVPRILKKHNDHGPVHYVFEAGHANKGEAEFLVNQMSTTEETRNFYFYSGHSFLPKQDAVPLQAADLLAWESAKFKDESVDGFRDIRKSLQALFEVDTSRYSVSFCGGEELKRTLDKYRAMGYDQIREGQSGKIKKQIK